MKINIKTIIKNVIMIFLLPIIVYLIFFIASNGTYGNISSLIANLRQSFAPTLISYAMCFNMINGRMDISAGSVVMLASMVGAKIVYLYDVGLVVFVLLVFGVGVIAGTFSGLLYIALGVPAIVTSLGVCMIYETLSNLFSISWVTPISGVYTSLGHYPYSLIIFLLVSILFYLIFYKTKFGYNVRATAGSQLISMNAGVNTTKTAFLCYVAASIFLGVASLLRISIQGSIDTPMYMSSTNVIFSSMLGIFVGNALEKYCNLAIGIFIGNFILNMLTSGLLNLGLKSSLQDTASGIFLLIIMIIAYNNERLSNYLSKKKEKEKLRQDLIQKQNNMSTY